MTHELDSVMIYIHPPLSIIGYAFIFAFIFYAFLKKDITEKNRLGNILIVAAWVFTLLGLVTGMLWAQIAWGSYWSWDPKETLTLALFLAVSVGLVAHFEKQPVVVKISFVLSCILVVATASASFIIAGLHSFLG